MLRYRGTGELAKLFPEATIYCHPRAEKHLVDPTRLVEATKKVYGADNFERQFGSVTAVAQGSISPPQDSILDRIRVLHDTESLSIGGLEFQCLHTRGHARHHIVMHEKATNS